MAALPAASATRAQTGADAALVADAVADQGDIAARGGIDRALVDDAARAGAAEAALAAAEVGIA